MRKVEISSDQVADIARELALGFGHSDPDILVAPGPAMRVADPFAGRELFAVPSASLSFPLWYLYSGAARMALAKAGQLVGVEFVQVQPEKSVA